MIALFKLFAGLLAFWLTQNSLMAAEQRSSFDALIQFIEAKQSKQWVKNNKHFLKCFYDQFLAHLFLQQIPLFIAVGGSPGAGKTTYRKQFIQNSNFYQHDMDEFIVALPDYQQDVKTIGVSAAIKKWWGIAKKCARLFIAFAIQSKYSIIYDQTCGSEDAYEDFVTAKKHGYHIKLIGLYAEKNITKERITKRAREDGRYVPDEVASQHRTQFSALWPYYLLLVDEAVLYDTSKDIPTLIFSSKEGVSNFELYQIFLDEGKSVFVAGLTKKWVQKHEKRTIDYRYQLANHWWHDGLQRPSDCSDHCYQDLGKRSRA